MLYETEQDELAAQADLEALIITYEEGTGCSWDGYDYQQTEGDVLFAFRDREGGMRFVTKQSMMDYRELWVLTGGLSG